ncbi:MAG TPA: toll/interleukin-1 receptor domain-containing protein [Rhizomicrobium sp.]|jgi:hypothetical protein|nr:toll/interleukin-1 receptor domain-containing protein [Rhizomicrobium sp.]
MAGEIFISYRRADQAWARLLHTLLQAEGVEAWYDAAQVGAGQDWRIATAKACPRRRIPAAERTQSGHWAGLSLPASVLQL